jgi:putative ABC transport system permease protein
VILYRLLLRLYPASFRAEYGREMTSVFERRRQAATATGSRVALWFDVVTDTITNAPGIHWDILRQDLRFATRTLTRTPALSLTVMLVAALGIGATTAAFTLADHVLIRPLPFPESDRLVKMWQAADRGRGGAWELSPGNYRDWEAQATSLDGMAAFTTTSGNLIGTGDPVRLDGALVSGDLFDVLRVPAALGRTLTPDDDGEKSDRTVVLSDRLWRTRFNGDPAILGRAITLNDTPRLVVGVMPPSFEFPIRTSDFWITYQFAPGNFEDRTDTYLNVIARLKQDVTIEKAQAEMSLIAAQLERTYPRANTNVGALVVWLRDEISSQSRMLLIGLVAAATALLLIACANLANLLLTRALARQRELAVRSALGAGRERLSRQMFTETGLLVLGGGAIGIAVAVSAVPVVARLVPTNLPIAEAPALDWRMLLAAAVSTIVTAVGAGVLPALRFSRHTDASALREGARAGTSRTTERLRATLVVAEVTASVVLLVSSGLLVRAMWKVQQIDPGFRSESVMTLRTSLPMPKYQEIATRQAFYDRVLGEIRAVPGVTSAAYISFLPMVMRGGIWPVTIDNNPEVPGEPNNVSLRFVTPGFFQTMGMPVRGRDIADSDTYQGTWVALVSESFVREHWPNVDPIGRHFTVAGRPRRVVGIAGDIRVRGLERRSEPQIYLPSPQADRVSTFYAPKDLVVKSTVPPSTLVPAIRAIIGRADPQQPISEIRTLTDIVELETAPRRVQVRVLAAFAAIAFLLAGIGLHGLLAFNVSQRAREIGVRIALGAERRTILGMVVGRSLVLTAVGLVLGSALAFATARAMQALLAGISPTDVVTFAGAVTLSLLMTVGGSLLPALRAVRVDPITVIRSE